MKRSQQRVPDLAIARARSACAGLTLGAALALAALSLGCVDEERREATGSDLYKRYCASCHGLEGRGDGPLAATLKVQPADLTRIAQRAGGRFDESEVMSKIDGRYLVAAHGPREMPVWGARFEEEHRTEPYSVYVGLLQSRALVDYLRSIQAKQ